MAAAGKFHRGAAEPPAPGIELPKRSPLTSRRRTPRTDLSSLVRASRRPVKPEAMPMLERELRREGDPDLGVAAPDWGSFFLSFCVW